MLYASARMIGAKHPTYITVWYRGYPADYILSLLETQSGKITEIRITIVDS
jgi:hypothetical protein